MISKLRVIDVVPEIKQKFLDQGGQAILPLQRGSYFSAKLAEGGIEVDNLGNQPYLLWCAFQEAVCVLIRNQEVAKRGDAMNSRLGDEELLLDSIEGHIAWVVYGKQVSDSVFRRITPIACILKWAGICKSEPGKLILL